MAVIKSGASSDQLTIDATSKAARVTMYDSSGTEITQPGAITQDMVVSTNNSSTANINNGNTFQGTSESTLGISTIQVNIFADKWLTLYVDQSNDGTNRDHVSKAVIIPASTSLNRNFTATQSYFRIRVANSSGGNTTTCRIQTCLLPVGNTLPDELTEGGALRVSTRPSREPDSGSYLYTVSTFRTLGTAASPQYLFTIENPAASLYVVAIRDLTMVTDSTAVLTTVAPQWLISRPASLPTNGTTLTAVEYRTDGPSPQAVCRGGTNADGAGATAITVSAGTTMRQGMIDRAHTVVGWFSHRQESLMPTGGAEMRQIMLLPGESLLVSTLTAAANTTHFIVNCSWSEYLYK